MKNLLKKISAVALSLIFAIGLTNIASVRADELIPVFNNLSADNEFLTGKNLTTNQSGDPINAEANQNVDVAVYYHNTTVDSVAKNTTIKINIPSTESLTHNITGILSADNAQSTSGTFVNGVETGKPGLTINSSGNTKLTYVNNSVRWYPDRMSTDGQGANLPTGQNGNNIITSGLNIGDLKGCFQYSGTIKFTVHLAGEVVLSPAIQISKDVRRAGQDNAFIDSTTLNPGNQVEYRLTVRNIDGAISARNLRVSDKLPDGVNYVGPTILRTNDGKFVTLPDGIISNDGIIVIPELKAGETITITFLASTLNTAVNSSCLINTAFANGDNTVAKVSDTATICFVVTPTPTPVPPTPKPITNPVPVSEIPKTGPESVGLISVITAIASTGLGKKYFDYRNLKKKSKNLDIR